MYYPCGAITHDIKIKIRKIKEKPCKDAGLFCGVWVFIFKNQTSLPESTRQNLAPHPNNRQFGR
ncbi:hypothetical protein [Moraxella lacunata]|uniref:hypothetical protein n=1 Tax=Moraxella lacunata TaxID=477 RepID=UPI003EE04B8A